MSTWPDEDARQLAAISSHQFAAATTPAQPTSELLGNFVDFARLFAQLDEPPVMELGKPLPKSKFVPRRRAGTCPAAHNDRLLRDN